MGVGVRVGTSGLHLSEPQHKSGVFNRLEKLVALYTPSPTLRSSGGGSEDPDFGGETRMRTADYDKVTRLEVIDETGRGVYTMEVFYRALPSGRRPNAQGICRGGGGTPRAHSL